ncbi:hypothetical protein R1flu_028779 [Riccia fluitans]|uniref:J domain-containing protein n=1 Tax=Riccia fluitans TaxID=41844 RepID=A0ABD1XMP6_9MARC
MAMELEDLYLVLGIENGGPEVAQLEVRKAYRLRALLCHPDKRRKDAAAAALEFDALQKAYEVLGDEKARKAYDDLWKLRKDRIEKEKQLSHKRQKMMQDLRDRERAFDMESREKREEEEVAKRLKAEIARVRAMRSKKQGAAGEGFSFVSSPNEGSARPQTTPATPAQTVEMEKTLKASWSCEVGGGGGYTAVRLTEIFQEFGTVEDVVIRQSKSKRKGSALVVMGSKEAAIAATAAASSACERNNDCRLRFSLFRERDIGKNEKGGGTCTNHQRNGRNRYKGCIVVLLRSRTQNTQKIVEDKDLVLLRPRSFKANLEREESWWFLVRRYNLRQDDSPVRLRSPLPLLKTLSVANTVDGHVLRALH